MENQSSTKTIMVIQAATNLHCGTGQGTGDIDLPTAKEAATGFPLIPGSTIKGVLRDHYQRGNTEDKLLKAAFGPNFANDLEDAHASALMFTDARVLLLPVRSAMGVFALVTCPLILQRFSQDMRYADLNIPGAVPSVAKDGSLVEPSSVNVVNGKLVLEDIDLKTETSNPDWKRWSAYLLQLISDKEWADAVMQPRLALISDDVFSFLCQVCLPVSARIKIDQSKGIVAKGALWYEESVPSETVFSAMAVATRSFTSPVAQSKALADQFLSGALTLQLGGKATTGKGLCRVHYVKKQGA